MPTTLRATTAERLEQYGPAADARWAPFFKGAGVPYPPNRIVLVGLKEERRLEVYAAGHAASIQRVADTPDLHFIRSFPIHAASGGPGPKLAEGDRQVPEGVYGIELLNPNSRFHLSLRVSYPNQHDRARARRDRRSQLGGDIMIHGSNVSVGCLAMGDESAEDIFVLAARTGIQKISVILAPRDLRVKAAPQDPTQPSWVPELYREIKSALASCCSGRAGGVNGATQAL